MKKKLSVFLILLLIIQTSSFSFASKVENTVATTINTIPLAPTTTNYEATEKLNEATPQSIQKIEYFTIDQTTGRLRPISNIGDQGMVIFGSDPGVGVDIEKRYTYGHTYASFATKAGTVKTDTMDYDDSPVGTEYYSPYYNNSTWIANKAIELYKEGWPPIVYAWTHSTICQ
ncbi:hypothetical protein [Guggenheimella bovis]